MSTHFIQKPPIRNSTCWILFLFFSNLNRKSCSNVLFETKRSNDTLQGVREECLRKFSNSSELIVFRWQTAEGRIVFNSERIYKPINEAVLSLGWTEDSIRLAGDYHSELLIISRGHLKLDTRSPAGVVAGGPEIDWPAGQCQCLRSLSPFVFLAHCVCARLVGSLIAAQPHMFYSVEETTRKFHIDNRTPSNTRTYFLLSFNF